MSVTGIGMPTSSGRKRECVIPFLGRLQVGDSRFFPPSPVCLPSVYLHCYCYLLLTASRIKSTSSTHCKDRTSAQVWCQGDTVLRAPFFPTLPHALNPPVVKREKKWEEAKESRTSFFSPKKQKIPSDTNSQG